MTTGARSPLAVAAVALVMAWGLGLSACGSDGGAADDDGGRGAEASADADGSTTSAPDGSTAGPTPEDQAIAAYEVGWEAQFEALDPPNPQHPALGEAFTGEAAESIVGVVADAQNAGHYIVGSMETHPEAVSVTVSQVLLRDCSVETSTTHDAATGAVVETDPHPPRLRQIEVVEEGGTWKVSEIRTLDEPCTPG